MALKSPEKVLDAGKAAASAGAVAVAEKDLSASQGGQTEVTDAGASKPPPPELANGNSTLEKRHSLGDDPAMTIEFLRARLLSERSASKSAKQRAQLLAKRVVELEQRLELEIGQRKKAEAAIREALAKLTQAGLIVDSSAFFSFSTEVATVELEGKDHAQSTTENGNPSAAGDSKAAGPDVQQQGAGSQDDEGSGKRASSGDEDSITRKEGKGSTDVANANGDEESSSSDEAVQLAADVAEFQAQQKPIAWKGKKGDLASQGSSQPPEEKRSPESLKAAWAIEVSADGVESPRRKNGRSLRRIQRRETRVVEERLKGMWDRLGEEMGTRRDGQQPGDLDDGSADAKANGSRDQGTDCHDGSSTLGSNADTSSVSFEKLIAEYEAEEKAQRQWERQYHAKQLAADSSSLNQDSQGGISQVPAATAEVAPTPAAGTVQVSDPESKLPDPAVPSTSQEESAEKECAAAAVAEPSSVNVGPDPDPSTEVVDNKIVSGAQDVAARGEALPEKTAEVLVDDAAPAPPSSGSQVYTQTASPNLESCVPETQVSVAEDKGPQLSSSAPLVSGIVHAEPEAAAVDMVSSEVQAGAVSELLVGAGSEVQVSAAAEEGVVTEVQAPGAVSSDVEALATTEADGLISPGSDAQHMESTEENGFEASNSTDASEGNDELSPSSQDHAQSVVQDDPSTMSSSAEHYDVSGGDMPASSEPLTGVKVQQDLMNERVGLPYEGANGAGRRRPLATSLDYRDHWPDGGPPPYPPEYGRRDLEEEWMRYRRPGHSLRGDMHYASRSVDFQDAMAEELAFRRMESEYYAQERRRRAHFRSRSPVLDYDRDLYEQSGLQRSMSITSRPLYQGLRGPPLYEPERHQRSRSTGRGYPGERAYRMYDMDDRLPYDDRDYGYRAVDHAYRTSFPEIGYERARLRQERAFRGPVPNERAHQEPLRREQYRGPQEYAARRNSFEGEVQISGLERVTSSDYHPAEYSTAQGVSPPTLDAEVDADVKPGGVREASAGLQGKLPSQAHEAVVKKETVRSRGDSVATKSSHPDPPAQASQRTPAASNPSVPQRRVTERTGRAQQGGGLAQQPSRSAQPERASRVSSRVSGASAAGLQRKDSFGKSSGVRRQALDRKSPVPTFSQAATSKAAPPPVGQPQTYLALPSYAGEGEERVEVEGDKVRPSGDKQQPSKSPKKDGAKTATDYSRTARPLQQKSPVAKEKRDNASPANRSVRDGPEDSKPILALPSYAGEGVVAEIDDTNEQTLQQETGADVSPSDASQLHQPPVDVANYGPNQLTNPREMSRFYGDYYRHQNARGPSAHQPGTGGPQSMARGPVEPQYQRTARPEFAKHAPALSSLPGYSEEGVTIHDREEMRFRGVERYGEDLHFEGRRSTDRVPLGLESPATHYAHLRESQQHYQRLGDPVHDAQVMRESFSARHASQVVGGRGTSSNGHLSSNEPRLYSAPVVDQAPGAGNLGEILKALQMAKDRIQSTVEEHTYLREQYNPQDPRSQVSNSNMLPPSRGHSSAEVGNLGPQQVREDMLRATVQDHSRAEVLRQYAPDASAPVVRIPRSSSVSSGGIDSPARPVFSRDEGSSLENLTSSYVDKLNVGKGIQFFFH